MPWVAAVLRQASVVSVAFATTGAGHRLVLHGLASEMLYELLVRAKRAHTAATA
jgi:hypothetical protein